MDARPKRKDILQICALGWPIGLQLGVEVGIFAAVGVFIARYGEIALAGHHIALTLASLSFAAAVGLGVAATTRVGMHIGAGRPGDALRAGYLAIGLEARRRGAGSSSARARGARAALRPDSRGHRGRRTLLRIAAVFAISDGIQVVAAGSLRGAKDTALALLRQRSRTLAHRPADRALPERRAGPGRRRLWWALSIS